MPTKAELLAENARLSAENADLLDYVLRLRSQIRQLKSRRIGRPPTNPKPNRLLAAFSFGEFSLRKRAGRPTNEERAAGMKRLRAELARHDGSPAKTADAMLTRWAAESGTYRDTLVRKHRARLISDLRQAKREGESGE